MALTFDLTFLFIVFSLLLGILLLIKPKKFIEYVRLYFLGIGVILILTIIQNLLFHSRSYSFLWTSLLQLILGLALIGLWKLLKKKPEKTVWVAIMSLWGLSILPILVLLLALFSFAPLTAVAYLGSISWIMGLLCILKEEHASKFFAIGIISFSLALMFSRLGM